MFRECTRRRWKWSRTLLERFKASIIGWNSRRNWRKWDRNLKLCPIPSAAAMLRCRSLSSKLCSCRLIPLTSSRKRLVDIVYYINFIIRLLVTSFLIPVKFNRIELILNAINNSSEHFARSEAWKSWRCSGCEVCKSPSPQSMMRPCSGTIWRYLLREVPLSELWGCLATKHIRIPLEVVKNSPICLVEVLWVQYLIVISCSTLKELWGRSLISV